MGLSSMTLASTIGTQAITSVADPDPTHMDPHQFWEARVDPAPHLNGKLDPDTDPHQSEMGEALVVILEH
jgi:hypothetical protein